MSGNLCNFTPSLLAEEDREKKGVGSAVRKGYRNKSMKVNVSMILKSPMLWGWTEPSGFHSLKSKLEFIYFFKKRLNEVA